MMTPRTSLAGLVALTACALPSTNVDTTNTPAEPVASGSNAAAQPRSIARRPEPTVLDAELLHDGQHVRLTLSEPVAPTEGVDPNDFRLSVGVFFEDEKYAVAYYEDLRQLSVADGLLDIRSISADGDSLQLELDRWINPADCVQFEKDILSNRSEPGINVDGGIFLHYAPGERPIVDADGNAMAAFAAEWVLLKRRGGETAAKLRIEGPAARQALIEPIRVRCRPVLPPGPR